jgi:5-formaminoimidazole-4-carboxamide-1-beta-D-ribofuranosyl 5'-monophosphate synthetase
MFSSAWIGYKEMGRSRIRVTEDSLANVAELGDRTDCSARVESRYVPSIPGMFCLATSGLTERTVQGIEIAM